MWKKHPSAIFESKSQVPVVFTEFADKFRIFYSARDEENKSLPFFIDVLKDDPSKIIRKCENSILNHGKIGSFDWAGVMPTEILRVGEKLHLYYIGWSRRYDVPYHNNLGLAISEDGENFKKVSDGPIFSTSRLEPGYVGTISIIQNENSFVGYYLSCRDWVKSSVGLEPVYDIKIARSKDGIDWTPTGITAINLHDEEGGLSQACVRKLTSGGYEMHFSSRKKVDYRTNVESSYKIHRATSEDALIWNRQGVSLDVSESGWDSEMVAYPYVVKHNNVDYLFYNGNNFGGSGFGYAVRESKLEK